MPWTINPSEQELAFLMEAGILLRDVGRYQQSREIFKGIRALIPKSEVPEVALGTLAFQERDFEAAEKHYRRALELNPRSAWAYAHLGELALFRLRKDEASVHLKTANELDPRGDHGKFGRALLELADMLVFQ
jgi:tetratricopeptide (TPR) repeat protein